MRVAVDFNGNLYDSLVDGKKLKEEQNIVQRNFFCPNCGKPVLLRSKGYKIDGSERVYHFAHMGGKGCFDPWDTETSVWYKKMCHAFDGRVVEKWISNDKGEKHQVDVLIGNTIILFKSKDIDPEDFRSRTNFFTELGYDLVWVLGVTRDWKSGKFTPIKSYKDYYGDMMLDWLNPRRMLGGAPRVANTCSWVNGQRVSICIGYEENKKLLINKLLWVKSSEEDEEILDWSKIRVNSTCTLTLKEVVSDPNVLFLSPRQYIENFVNSLGVDYSERYKGVNWSRLTLDSFRCPRSNHSVKPDEECMGCGSCLGVDMFHQENSRLGTRVFCSYPKKSGRQETYGEPRVKRVAR